MRSTRKEYNYPEENFPVQKQMSVSVIIDDFTILLNVSIRVLTIPNQGDLPGCIHLGLLVKKRKKASFKIT